jgi:hypothetical protein
MAERKAVVRQMAPRYARASKAEKGRILDELCALTGWTRRHARRALHEVASGALPRPGRPGGRPRTYGEEVLEPLTKVWATLNGPCGKRLAPFIGEMVEVMERWGEFRLTPEVRGKLLSISGATIDRILAPERARLRVKGRSGTKPGTLLKAQIPIRTHSEWDERRPGFCEVDLVGHEGGDASGQFCQTLDLTCVATGWTEMRAVPNKAQRWVFEALTEIEEDLPFPLLGLDSDNGSEFINDQLFRYCSERGITFTRSRAFRKNDNCFVEQKNWSVTRQAVGYARYDSPAELEVLAELYGYLRLYVNFFQPVMKLVEKTREGAKVRKRYDTPRTPYRRVLESAEVSRAAKANLTRQYRTLNPVELKRAIGRCQDRLMRLTKVKQTRKEVKAPPADHPWRTSFVRQRKVATRTA